MAWSVLVKKQMIDHTNYGIVKEGERGYAKQRSLELQASINEDTEKQARVDHDRLYKELFETFFADFMELFFPEAYEAIDLRHLSFLSQDVFTDVVKGERRSIDLLAETKLKGEKTAIIIHVENQAYPQAAFNERMFIYFSRLYEKYRCNILPIAVFSHGKMVDEPSGFQVSFPFVEVLDFSFLTIELHKKNWREYIRYNNPVAAALLSQMGFTEDEKVQVKREFLRMLVRLQLDPAKMQLITGFFETYITLNEKEELSLKKQIETLEKAEKEEIFRIETSWERKGRIQGEVKGKLEGKLDVAKRMLEHGMSVDQIVTLTDLPRDQVEKLQQDQ